MRSPRAIDLALVFLAFAPVLAGLGNELQEVDPPQYAEVARRMYRSGDWLHMEDNQGPFLNKPPVTFWMMAGSFHLFGPTSFAARLPSVLAGILLLLATAGVGRELWDARTGRLAAALLGATPSFHSMIADPKVDLMVTAMVASTLWMLLTARRRPRFMWLAWLFVGLGVLSKGPIGLMIPLAAVGPELVRRRWGQPDAPAGSLWGRLRPFRLLSGPLIAIALMIPWYLQIVAEHGAQGPFFLLWEQSFGRLFLRTYRNPAGPLFFTHTALWAFLPFTVPLLWHLAARARAALRARVLPAPDERRVVLWWLAIPFVAVSLSSYKLPQYIYWIAPAAALLVAGALQEAWPRWLTWAQGAVSGAVVAVIALLLFGAFPPAHPATAWAWLGGVTLLVVVAWLVAGRMDTAVGHTARMIAPLVAFAFFFHGYLHPSLTEYQPDDEWGALALEHDPGGTVLPFVETRATNASAFYARRKTVEVTPEALQALVETGQTRLAVVADRALPSLPTGLRVTPLRSLPRFHTSKATPAFLNAATRDSVVERLTLVELSVAR